MPNDLWYFAYGSNMDLARKQGRTGAIRESHLATLSGYRLAFNKMGSDGVVYANLFADPTEETLGVIYRCTSETLNTLDGYEGASSGHYQRTEVQVRRLDGQIVSAIAYVARPEVVVSESRPSDEYFGYIRRGTEAHRFPTNAIRAIEIRAFRRACDPGKRLWRAYQVDEGLENDWLYRLNALHVFELTSICQGHLSARRSILRSHPHIILRVRDQLVASAIRWIQKGDSSEFPQPESLPLGSVGTWSIEHIRSLKLSRGAIRFSTSDRVLLRATGSVAVGTSSDRTHTTEWFTTVIPEIEAYDRRLSGLLGFSSKPHA
jgi:cation transport regulator ChaC